MTTSTGFIAIALIILAPINAYASAVNAEDEFRLEVAKIAQIKLPLFEETKRARNEKLNALFRKRIAALEGSVSSESLKRFNALLKEYDLTHFDDFLDAETRPLRYVRDPDSGAEVPIVGSLGSDIINPWLGALELIAGKPLDEQPMYHLAANALRDHIDFALIGIRDPNLTLDLLPPKMRENAALAYRQLNPTNKFDGGFDHPLYYACVREAAKKLFRKDYPNAKITIADLVVPEEKGGFGLKSCLLCHDRDHAGVYKRLLSQGIFHETKAADFSSDKTAELQKRNAAKVYLLAAQRVLESHPDKIDAVAVRKSLALRSASDLERLKPGYDDFHGTLKKLGCIQCHSSDNKQPPEKNPATDEAYVLHSSAYYKTDDIKALITLINVENVDKSKLLRKVNGKTKHTGAEDLKLTPAQIAELRSALIRWISPFEEQK